MIAIRKAKQEERESLWRLHTRAILEICGSHYSQDELEAWEKVLKPGRYQKPIAEGTLVVAMDGDDIVGFGNLNRETGEIEAVYVSPNYLRLGIGMRILQTLEGVARDSGLKALRLSSTLNAVPFYESSGYRSQQQTKYLLSFGRVACVTMIKKL
jgi:GNAT superfamily N-acetyltransferase